MSLPAVDLLALSRLLTASAKGETPAKLIADLRPMVEHRWPGPSWPDRLDRSLEGLESAGMVERVRDAKGKLTAKLVPTPEGRRAAAQALGLDEGSPRPTWAKLKATILPALAVGRPGPGGVDLRVEILKDRYKLDLPGRAKIKEATDATAATLIGLDAGEKFTTDAILRKLLADAGIAIPAGKKPSPATIAEALFRRELGDPGAKKPLDLLAARGVDAPQATPAAMGLAVVRSWLDRAEPAETVPFDLDRFAGLVSEAARQSPTGWFGEAKVFLSHVWKAVRDTPTLQGMDFPEFQLRLIEAHRARLLELGRADLVEAMDPADVRESATPYLNATYHFLRIEDQDR